MSDKRSVSSAEDELRGMVTSLRHKSRDAGLVRLYLDGEFALVVHPATAEALGLEVGTRVDRRAWQRLCREKDLRRALDLARRYMARAERSVEEVRIKIDESGTAHEISDEVLRELQKQGYLDDARLARRFVESRFRSRGYGPARLHAELRHRRISDDTARQAVGALVASEDMLEAARRAAARRWRKADAERDVRSALAGLARFLGRLGYDTDTVRTVVEEYGEM